MDWINAWLFPVGSVLLGGVGLLVLVRGLFGRRFTAGKTRACRRCRYDMTETAGHRCSECGYIHRHEGEHYAGRRRWLVAGLGLVLLVGAVGVGMTPGVRRDGWLRLLPLELQVRLFHLERNNQAMFNFTAALRGYPNAMFYGGGIAPTTGRFGTLSEEEVLRLQRTAGRTALSVLNRDSAPAQVDRAWQVLMLQSDPELTADDVSKLASRFGATDHHVRQLLSRWSEEWTAELYQLRRDSFDGIAPEHRFALAKSMNRYPEGDKDFDRIAQVLAGEIEVSHRSDGMLGSRANNFARELHPEIWTAYARHVRKGSFGNMPTLRDGVDSSPVVLNAAVYWCCSQDPKDVEREVYGWLEDHVRKTEIEVDSDLFPVMRERFASVRAPAFRDFYEVVLGRHDKEFAAFLIDLAENADERWLREAGTRAMRELDHNRVAATAYLAERWNNTETAWIQMGWVLRGMEEWGPEDWHPSFEPVALWDDLLNRLEGTDNPHEIRTLRWALERRFSFACTLAMLRRLVTGDGWTREMELVMGGLAENSSVGQSKAPHDEVDRYLELIRRELLQSHRHRPGGESYFPEIGRLLVECEANRASLRKVPDDAGPNLIDP